MQDTQGLSVPGEVIAEAQLEQAIFRVFAQRQECNKMRVGDLRVAAKKLFQEDGRAGGYSADVGDVIDKLVALGCFDYDYRGDWLTLTEGGQARVEALRSFPSA